MRSRVPFRIDFPDYSTEEMAEIVELEARKRGFSIEAGSREKIMEICTLATGRPDAGNGRFCRNLIESAIINYASRIYGHDNETKDSSLTLLVEDFASYDIFKKTSRCRIGFCT